MKRTTKTTADTPPGNFSVHEQEARAKAHPADLEDGLHDTHQPATQDDVGSMARLLLTDGSPHVTGRIVSYTDVPTVDLRDAAGHVHHWRADLTSVIEDRKPVQIPRHLYDDLVHARTPGQRNDAINAIVIAAKDTP